MDAEGLMAQFANTLFKPNGKDDTGAYMVIGEYLVHVRTDDLLITQGMALKDIWPLVDKVQTL